MTSDWSGLALDIRYAFRAIARSRAFTLTATIVLGGSVAVGTAVFAYVQGTLLDAPPFAQPEQIVLAWGSEPASGQRRDVISGSNFIDLRARAKTVAPLAAFHFDDVTFMTGGRPLVLGALNVSVDFLRVLGVVPAMGGDFGDGDRQSAGRRAAIVSHGFWQEALGGQAGAIGSTLDINGLPVTIVGVLPARFRFAGTTPIYLPLRDDELAAEDRTHHHYYMVGRLLPGASPAAATSELTAIMGDIATADPRLARWTVLVEPLMDVTVEAVRPALWALVAAVLLLFAVGIANLGALLRIRTLERSGEIAVRSALGATRVRALAVVGAESVALATLGGLLGIASTPVALQLLATVAPAQVLIPGSAASVPVLRATLDSGLLVTAFLAALAAGVLVAIPSLLAALRVSPAAIIGRAGSRVAAPGLARWLVGAEVAMATMLAIGATITWRSAHFLATRDGGVESVRVLTAQFANVGDLPVNERVAYYTRVVDAVSQVPGVVRAGIIDYLPFEGEDDFKGMRFPERPVPPRGQGIREEWRRVSHGYFEASGMRILRGRAFAAGDFQGAPRAVVINRAFATKHYQAENPVGRRLMLAERGYTDLEIVGIVADVLERGPMVPAPAMVYVPFQAAPRGNVAIIVKTNGSPMSFAEAVRAAIWSVDGRQPVMGMQPLETVVRSAMATPTMIMRVVGALAIASLVLAALGVFAVVAFAVRLRTRELGVRMALGATALQLERQVIAGFVPVAGAGVAAGAATAALGVGALRSVLYGVAPVDPFAFGAAIAGVTGIALLAAWLPARAVSAVDPSRVIRDG